MITSTANQSGGSSSAGRLGTLKTAASDDVSITLQPSRIVNQFSQAKLPEATSHSWVTTTMAPAMLATGWGANRPNGTASCDTWLPATSTRCSGLGIWWKNQLSGPGMGCVSWW